MQCRYVPKQPHDINIKPVQIKDIDKRDNQRTLDFLEGLRRYSTI